ncbi:response regulator [Zhouia sp. PK063]|uniref:response regulator n=1 Tax=Zhouia sp. PK063 TaxID=3373602 RepID=UPI0037AF45B0
MIKLVIAEDHNALIDGIKLFVEYEEDIELVGTALNGEQLCELVKEKQPDVVITDIRMPIMDGIAATKEILRHFPNTKVIAFTMFNQEEAVHQMIEAGVKGYILKNSSLKDLLSAIRTVYKGQKYYDINLKIEDKNSATGKKSVLTFRQQEILKLISQGKTNIEIGELLFIGKATVETHRKNMIKKLNLKGAGELLRYAMESKYEF